MFMDTSKRCVGSASRELEQRKKPHKERGFRKLNQGLRCRYDVTEIILVALEEPLEL
jgi:hypothetical protein